MTAESGADVRAREMQAGRWHVNGLHNHTTNHKVLTNEWDNKQSCDYYQDDAKFMTKGGPYEARLSMSNEDVPLAGELLYG